MDVIGEVHLVGDTYLNLVVETMIMLNLYDLNGNFAKLESLIIV